MHFTETQIPPSLPNSFHLISAGVTVEMIMSVTSGVAAEVCVNWKELFMLFSASHPQWSLQTHLTYIVLHILLFGDFFFSFCGFSVACNGAIELASDQAKLNVCLKQQCDDHAPQTKMDCSCRSWHTFHRPPEDEESRRNWLNHLNLKRPLKTLYTYVHVILLTKNQRRQD